MTTRILYIPKLLYIALKSKVRLYAKLKIERAKTPPLSTRFKVGRAQKKILKQNVTIL